MHQLGFCFYELVVGGHRAPGIFHFFAQIQDLFHALIEGGKPFLGTQ